VNGSHIFNDYHKDWDWYYKSVDYQFASGINKGNCAYLLTGRSTWQVQGASASHGHAVVVTGWNDSDRHIWVSLCWGDAPIFKARWVPFPSISDPCAAYVTSFHGKQAGGEDLPAAVLSLELRLKSRKTHGEVPQPEASPE
jgi:hypothetical protein